MKQFILLITAIAIIFSFELQGAYYCECADPLICGNSWYSTTRSPFTLWVDTLKEEDDFEHDYAGDEAFYSNYSDNIEFQIIVCERDDTGKPTCSDAADLN